MLFWDVLCGGFLLRTTQYEEGWHSLTTQEFKYLSNEEKELRCLSVFHTINWFRELVNAFASYEDADTFSTHSQIDLVTLHSEKVLQRLGNILELEQQLNEWLEDTQQLSLPQAKIKFESTKKKGKSHKSKETEDSEEHPKEAKHPPIHLLRPYFREFEVIVHAGLTFQLSILRILAFSPIEGSTSVPYVEFEVWMEWNNSNNSSHTSSGCCYKICMGSWRSYVRPVKRPPSCLRCPNHQRLGLLPIIHQFKHLRFWSLFFLPCVLTWSSLLKNYWAKIPERSKRYIVANIDSLQINEHLLPCFTILLECFEKLFSFEELYSPSNVELLCKILYGMTTKSPSSKEVPPLDHLVPEVFEYFTELWKVTEERMELEVLLFGVLRALLRDKATFPKLATQLSSHADDMLQKEWKQKPKAEHVNFLLQHCVMLNESPIEKISHFALKVLTTSVKPSDNSKEINVQSDYGTLTNQTFALYYKVLLTQLVEVFQGVTMRGNRMMPSFSLAVNDNTDVTSKISELTMCVDVFTALLQLTKVKGNLQQVLLVSLKQGKLFVESFLKVVPFLGHHYKKHNHVQALVKNLQAGTRIMQVSFLALLCLTHYRHCAPTPSHPPSFRKLLLLFPKFARCSNSSFSKWKQCCKKTKFLKPFG